MILLDSNILIRLANSNDPQHGLTQDAVQKFGEQAQELAVAPQCLYEFWVVSTRPAAARGGLGRTAEETRRDVEEFLRLFCLIDDGELLTPWLDLVKALGVLGTAAHDARLVACMTRANISTILTFNTQDFARFERIVAISPYQAVQETPQT